MVGKIQRDTTVAIAQRFHADPHDLACRDDGVEVCGIVSIDPGGKDLRLENRGWQRCALQLLDGVEQRVGAASSLYDALPRRRETAERRLIDRFDLLPELGE